MSLLRRWAGAEGEHLTAGIEVDGLRVSNEASELCGDFIGVAAEGDAGGLFGPADQDAEAAVDEAGVAVGTEELEGGIHDCKIVG